MKFFLLLVSLTAFTNSVLYSCLLPLWEGFDEPFHYGYVQSVEHRVPILNRTPLSAEVRQSLNLVPISFILPRSIPGTTAFETWFDLPQIERQARQRAVASINGALQDHRSDLLNYEAQQAPLSYLAIAPLDTLIRSEPLPTRILILRLGIALASTLLVLTGTLRLGEVLELPPEFRYLLATIVFEAQILSSALYHIDNDWLSISASVWFNYFAAKLWREGRSKFAYWLVVVCGIGLLAKAYFLAFIPVFFLVLVHVCLKRRLTWQAVFGSTALLFCIAGPWYLRNLVLYGTAAGMQENINGAGHIDVLYSFLHINWSRVLIDSARWSLWTGNESHFAFSRSTLNVELALFLAGGGLYGVTILKAKRPEIAVHLAVGFFVAALGYDLCVTWADTHALQNATGPYYSPCILIPFLALIVLGMLRSGIAGKALLTAIAMVSWWIMVLTYLGKMIPYYGGLIGKSTFSSLWAWWVTKPKDILETTTLAPAPAVYCLVAVYMMLLLSTNTVLIRALWQTRSLESNGR